MSSPRSPSRAVRGAGSSEAVPGGPSVWRWPSWPPLAQGAQLCSESTGAWGAACRAAWPGRDPRTHTHMHVYTHTDTHTAPVSDRGLRPPPRGPWTRLSGGCTGVGSSAPCESHNPNRAAASCQSFLLNPCLHGTHPCFPAPGWEDARGLAGHSDGAGVTGAFPTGADRQPRPPECVCRGNLRSDVKLKNEAQAFKCYFISVRLAFCLERERWGRGRGRSSPPH